MFLMFSQNLACLCVTDDLTSIHDARFKKTYARVKNVKSHPCYLARAVKPCMYVTSVTREKVSKTLIVACPDMRGLWWPHQDSVLYRRLEKTESCHIDPLSTEENRPVSGIEPAITGPYSYKFTLPKELHCVG